MEVKSAVATSDLDAIKAMIVLSLARLEIVSNKDV